MKVESLINIIGSEFYTGVPDSRLKAFCDCLLNTYGIDRQHHIIAANEGNAAAIAAGYHLATGMIPVVYMQNSGEGNIINPLASLLNKKVYAIPCVFIIGWRGEPGVCDEPQHICQGKVTCRLLEVMGVAYFVIGKNTEDKDVQNAMEHFRNCLKEGRDVAFVISKGALTYDRPTEYRNANAFMRESAIRCIVNAAGEDTIVCTTGQAGRELFEIREASGQGHERDFLNVGSMGHASSIALGVALGRPEKRVWCIDGDGAVLMHMGAMAVIGNLRPENLIHVVINNEAHGSVGGMPTVACTAHLRDIAKGCGYVHSDRVSNEAELKVALQEIKRAARLSFLEIHAAIGARSNLGRPTISLLRNKEMYMKWMHEQ